MGLYIDYYLTVTKNPGYSFNDFDFGKSTLSKVVYSLTAIVFVIYLSLDVTCIILNFSDILRQPKP
jgi:hypothetical protein